MRKKVIDYLSTRRSVVLTCPHCSQQAMSIVSKMALRRGGIFLCNACKGQVTLGKPNKARVYAAIEIIFWGALVGLFFLGFGLLPLIIIFLVGGVIGSLRSIFYDPLSAPSTPRKKMLFKPRVTAPHAIRIIFSPLIMNLVWLALWGSWFTINLFDAPLDRDFETYMAGDNPPPHEQNGFFAFAGLAAPSGQDAFQFGLQRYESEQAQYAASAPMNFSEFTESLPNLNGSGVTKDVSPNDSTASQKPVLFEPYVQNGTYVISKTGSLDCWILPKIELENIRKVSRSELNCMAQSDLVKHINGSEEHLERYVAIYAYPRFYEQGVAGSGSTRAHILITLNQYANARNTLWAQNGQREYAIRYWLADMQFLNRAILDDQDEILKAVLYTLVNQDLGALKVMLEADPSLATAYHDEILAVLHDPASPKIKELIQSSFRQEYKRGIGFFAKYTTGAMFHATFKPNATTNSMIAHYQNIFAIAEKSPGTYGRELALLKKGYQEKEENSSLLSVLYDLIRYNSFGKLTFPESSFGNAHMEHIWGQAASRRMLALYVQALAKGITPENMPAYLNGSDKGYYNPYTNAPFQWNEPTQSIYYVLEGIDGGRDYRKDVAYP